MRVAHHARGLGEAEHALFATRTTHWSPVWMLGKKGEQDIRKTRVTQMDTCSTSTEGSTENQKSIRMAIYRKKIKEMMFLYMALHQGWHVQMLPNKTFKFTHGPAHQ
jgi:hypothetical protein